MKKLKSTCMVPPECCVVVEMEKGAKLGYRKAVLLQEIEALGSMNQAAKVSHVELFHAQELIEEMNREFVHPLVTFPSPSHANDQVQLTHHGQTILSAYWKVFEPVWTSIQEERSRHY